MGEELNQNLFVDDQGAFSAGSDDEIYVWAGSKEGTEKTQIFLQILFPWTAWKKNIYSTKLKTLGMERISCRYLRVSTSIVTNCGHPRSQQERKLH